MHMQPMAQLPPIVTQTQPKNGTSSNNNEETNKKPAPKKKAPPKEKKEDMRFAEAEKMELMSILEQIVPVSQVDWESVESDYNFNFPERERTKDSLRRFFNGCVKKKSPTGNPNIPAWIRKAKEIQEAIINKSDAVIDLDDDDDDLQGLSNMLNRRPQPEWSDGARARELEAEGKQQDNGDDDDDDDDNKPAARPFSADKIDSGKGKRKHNAKTDETNQILQAIMMSDELNREAAEQRRKEERERDKRIERSERRRERKSDKRLELMLGLMTGVMAS